MYVPFNSDPAEALGVEAVPASIGHEHWYSLAISGSHVSFLLSLVRFEFLEFLSSSITQLGCVEDGHDFFLFRRSDHPLKRVCAKPGLPTGLRGESERTGRGYLFDHR